jgi:hypothetical protein
MTTPNTTPVVSAQDLARIVRAQFRELFEKFWCL